jgi:hypothetical protein
MSKFLLQLLMNCCAINVKYYYCMLLLILILLSVRCGILYVRSSLVLGLIIKRS